VAQAKSASSGSSSRPRRTSAARSGGGNSSAGSGSRSGSGGRSSSSAARASSNGASAAQGGRSVVSSIAYPVASAMAGAAAAIALSQRNAKRPKKVLGVSIPGTGRNGGTDGLARNVGEVAKQLARLADEVRSGRQKAEEIGKALR
jgi:hypothetical protein